MTFSFHIKKNSTEISVDSAFIVAVRKNGKYKPVTNPRYITNPSRAASYRYTFPTAVSKKGLQTSHDMREDGTELNVRNATVNVSFSDMIATEYEKNNGLAISWNYKGNTFWYRKTSILSYDQQLQALHDSDAVASIILMLGWRDDLTGLIYRDGRVPGHEHYAWNVGARAARIQFEAAISFLANRYSTGSGGYAKVVNWIVGNEVNNYNRYYYAGDRSLSSYAQLYANAFRLTYNTVTSVYSKARVYISLDHIWNMTTIPGTFPARKTMNAIASALRRQGSIPWNVAFHPYNTPMTSPRFWDNTDGLIESTRDTPIINMSNIGQLTSYIRRRYGRKVRVILSEIGYTSVVNGTTDVSKQQSAAIVYSYYLAEADDMVDSIIFNRQVDNSTEKAQGLNLGLWTSSPGTAGDTAESKKESWTVFKYMDTDLSPSVSDQYLEQIGKNSWSEAVGGYSSQLYSKTSAAWAQMRIISSYRNKISFGTNWKPYGAVDSFRTGKTVYRVRRDSSRNRNSLWGVKRTFATPLSFTADNPCFHATIQIRGELSGNAVLKVRFYSGNNILESSATVPSGRKVKIEVPVSQWQYAGSVTGIQITASPTDGQWNQKSYLLILKAGQ